MTKVWTGAMTTVEVEGSTERVGCHFENVYRYRTDKQYGVTMMSVQRIQRKR